MATHGAQIKYFQLTEPDTNRDLNQVQQQYQRKERKYLKNLSAVYPFRGTLVKTKIPTTTDINLHETKQGHRE